MRNVLKKSKKAEQEPTADVAPSSSSAGKKDKKKKKKGSSASAAPAAATSASAPTPTHASAHEQAPSQAPATSSHAASTSTSVPHVAAQAAAVSAQDAKDGAAVKSASPPSRKSSSTQDPADKTTDEPIVSVAAKTVTPEAPTAVPPSSSTHSAPTAHETSAAVTSNMRAPSPSQPQPPQRYGVASLGQLFPNAPSFVLGVRPGDREVAADMWQAAMREGVAAVVAVGGRGEQWRFYPDDGEEMYLRGVCVCGNESQKSLGHRWCELEVRATEPRVRRASSLARDITAAATSPSKTGKRQETSVMVFECTVAPTSSGIRALVDDVVARLGAQQDRRVMVLCDADSAGIAAAYCIAHALRSAAASTHSADTSALRAFLAVTSNSVFQSACDAIDKADVRELWESAEGVRDDGHNPTGTSVDKPQAVTVPQVVVTSDAPAAHEGPAEEKAPSRDAGATGPAGESERPERVTEGGKGEATEGKRKRSVDEGTRMRREASAPVSSHHTPVRATLSEPAKQSRRSSVGAIPENSSVHEESGGEGRDHHADAQRESKQKRGRRKSLSNWLRGSAPAVSPSHTSPLLVGSDSPKVTSPEQVSNSPLQHEGDDDRAESPAVLMNPFVAYFQSAAVQGARVDGQADGDGALSVGLERGDAAEGRNPFAAVRTQSVDDDWPIPLEGEGAVDPFQNLPAVTASWHFALEKTDVEAKRLRMRSNSMSLNPFETAYAPNAPEWDKIHPASQAAAASSRRFSSFFPLFVDDVAQQPLAQQAIAIDKAAPEFHALVAADRHADASDLYFGLKERLPEHCGGDEELATQLHAVLATWLYRLPLAASSLRYFVHVLNSVACLDRVSSLALARLLLDMGRVALFDRLYRENRIRPSPQLAAFLHDAGDFGVPEAESRFARHVTLSRVRHARTASLSSHDCATIDEGVSLSSPTADGVASAQSLSASQLRRSSSGMVEPDAGEASLSTLRVLSIRASADAKCHARVLEALLALRDCDSVADYLFHVGSAWSAEATNSARASQPGSDDHADPSVSNFSPLSLEGAGVTPGFESLDAADYVRRMCAVNAERAVDVAVLLATAVRLEQAGKVGAMTLRLARVLSSALPSRVDLAVRFLHRCLEESATVAGRLSLADSVGGVFDALLELHLAQTNPPNTAAAIAILTGAAEFDRRRAAELCQRAGMTLWHLLLLVDSRDRLVAYNSTARKRVRPFWGDLTAALAHATPTLSAGEVDALLAMDTLGADGRLACLDGLLQGSGRAGRSSGTRAVGHVADACLRLGVHLATSDGVAWETIVGLFERAERDDLAVRFARELYALPPDHPQSLFAGDGQRFARLCDAAARCNMGEEACAAVRTRLVALGAAGMTAYVATSLAIGDFGEVRRVCETSNSLDPIAVKRVLCMDLDAAWTGEDSRVRKRAGTTSESTVDDYFSSAAGRDEGGPYGDSCDDTRVDVVLALTTLCVRYGMVEDLVHFLACRGRLDLMTSAEALPLCVSSPTVLPSTVSTLLALGWPRDRVLSAIAPFVSPGRTESAHAPSGSAALAARAVAAIDRHYAQLRAEGGGDSDPSADWGDTSGGDPMRAVRVVRRLARSRDAAEWARCVSTGQAQPGRGDRSDSDLSREKIGDNRQPTPPPPHSTSPVLAAEPFPEKFDFDAAKNSDDAPPSAPPAEPEKDAAAPALDAVEAAPAAANTGRTDTRRAVAIVSALRDGVGFACFSSPVECEVAVEGFVSAGMGLEASEWLESVLLRNFELSQRRDLQTLLCRLTLRHAPQTLSSILTFLDNVDALTVASEAKAAGMTNEYRTLMLYAGHPFEAASVHSAR